MTPYDVGLRGRFRPRAREQASRGVEFALEPLHVVDIGQAFLGVAGEAVSAGAAGEIGAAGRMGAGKGAVGDAVAVDIVVAAKVRERFPVPRRRGPCRGRKRLRSSQAKGAQRCEFMPMSRSSMTNTSVCSRSARSKALAANSNASAGSSGIRSTCLVSPCEAKAQDEQVRLLRAGRHAGRRAAALHVEHYDRDFREIGEAEEFLHQRNAGARGRGEGARAVPAGPDRDADGGDLILRLDDGVVLLAGCRVDAEAGAVALERLRERGRGGDRVPGAHRRPAIDRAERRRRNCLRPECGRRPPRCGGRECRSGHRSATSRRRSRS